MDTDISLSYLSSLSDVISCSDKSLKKSIGFLNPDTVIEYIFYLRDIVQNQAMHIKELQQGVTVGLIGCHGKRYVSIQPGGEIEINRDRFSTWECLMLEYKDNKYVHIKSCHGKYLHPKEDGSIKCDRDYKDEETKLECLYAGNKIGFKAFTGKFLSAQRNGKMEANRDNFKGWEMFEVVFRDVKSFANSVKCTSPSSSIAVKDPSQLPSPRSYLPDSALTVRLAGCHSNEYVSIQPSGEVQVNRCSSRTWECLTFEYEDDDYVHIKSCHGKYLHPKKDGSILCDRDYKDEETKLECVHAANGKTGFKTFIGTFLSAQKDGTIEANRYHFKGWEMFEMFCEDDGPVRSLM